jgi:predicted dithiol-disulfide oxidoreductase (DUF899 family)
MSNDAGTRIGVHEVVSREEWLEKRRELLAREKEFTRARDELSRRRRELPWMKVEKRYLFDGPNGAESLADLFDGRSQLAVYHFMYPPDWEEGCLHCSFWADHYDGMQPHLEHRDVTFVVVSRAPLAKIAEFQQRMGWKFKWVSSFHTDFNFDFGASFTPQEVERGDRVYNFGTMDAGTSDREGASVFYKDETGAIFHTYSTFARGIDMLNTTYQWLDLMPKGRDEDPDDVQGWVRHHDRY